MNLGQLSNSLVPMTASFSGLFGGNPYQPTSLIRMQMLMLQNISQKLDVIKDQIDLVLDEISALKQDVGQIPFKVVSQFYRDDAQAYFVVFEDFIAAHIIDSEAGDARSAEKVLKPFSACYADFLRVRSGLFQHFSRQMEEGSEAIIPIVCICLHYELICLTLTDMPRSLFITTLGTYKNYLQDWLAHLEEGKDPVGLIPRLTLLRKEQLAAVTEVLNAPVFSASTSETIVKPIPNDTPGSESIVVSIDRYQYSLTPSPGLSVDTERAPFDELLASGLMPQKVSCALAVKPRITLQWEIVHSTPYKRPTNLDDSPTDLGDGFVVKETRSQLKGLGRPNKDPDNIPAPSIAPRILELETQIGSRGHEIIAIATLVSIASEALNVISGVLAQVQPAYPANRTFGTDAKTFALMIEARGGEWDRILRAKAETADADYKAKLAAIADRMADLKAQSSSIMTQYWAAEREAIDAADQDILKQVDRALAPISREVSRFVKSVEREHRKFVHDLEWNIAKAAGDVVDEFGRAGKNIEVAVAEAFDYIEAETRASFVAFGKVEQRVREGKIIDAVWEGTIGRMKETEANFLVAVQSSSLLNNIAMAAASIYGGPYGSAAYAAWLTYKQTGGDLGAALKAGLIAGLTAEGMQLADGIPKSELVKRSLATAAVGAAAIAASGGDEKAIIEGFLKGAALTFAREYYAEVTARKLEGEVATENPIAKLSPEMKDQYGLFLNEDGNPALFYNKETKLFETRIDNNNIPRTVCHVGIAVGKEMSGADYLIGETAIPMQALARGIPLMNDMAAFHDQWCNLVKLNDSTIIALTIIPASILTVVGSNQPLQQQVLDLLNSRVTPDEQPEEKELASVTAA